MKAFQSTEGSPDSEGRKAPPFRAGIAPSRRTFVTRPQKVFNYLSYPVFALIPFFDLFSSFLTFSFLLLYFYFQKDRKASPLLVLLPLLTLLAFFLKSSLTLVPLKQLFLLGPYSPQNLLFDFFSDSRGLFGFSLFALLLALFGLASSWKKKKIYLAYPYLFLFLLLSFYQTSFLIYLNFLIVFFASLGFESFLPKRWALPALKNFTLFLLLLGLVFSTLTSLSNLSSLPPAQEIRESLFWLRDNTVAYKAVFSHPRDSYFVEYFARRPAFLHYHDPGFEAKNEIAQKIFQSSYIKETFPLLEQNGISHLYLSPQTKADLPTDQGLIFLLQNERFKRLYTKSHNEIWRFN